MNQDDEGTPVSSFASLATAAKSGPIVSSLTGLESQILESEFDIEVINGVDQFWSRYYDPTDRFAKDVVVNDKTGTYQLNPDLSILTFPNLEYRPFTGTAYDTTLNDWITSGDLAWNDVERETLNQSDIADRIVNACGNEDVLIYIVIDGLSYRDWTANGYPAESVYVDCPTITDCGYPNAIFGGFTGQSLATRLHSQGYKNRLAFTYWEKDQSALTEKLHRGFSPNDIVGDVVSFEDVITHLRHENWTAEKRTYIQITLTGPERTAHSMKEHPNVEAEVETVYEKISRLEGLLHNQSQSYRLYATADHGMIWRMHSDDDLQPLVGDYPHTLRRYAGPDHDSIRSPLDLSVEQDQGHTEQWDGDDFLRLVYPYLFYNLKGNEHGVHGGYSYQECIVPLITSNG